MRSTIISTILPPKTTTWHFCMRISWTVWKPKWTALVFCYILIRVSLAQHDCLHISTQGPKHWAKIVICSTFNLTFTWRLSIVLVSPLIKKLLHKLRIRLVVFAWPVYVLYVLLCFFMGFRARWGWVNTNRTFIFGWNTSIPETDDRQSLNSLWIHPHIVYNFSKKTLFIQNRKPAAFLSLRPISSELQSHIFVSHPLQPV